MPALEAQVAPPSTLADVIGQVIDAFQEMADATPILVGRRYLEDFGIGASPRVLFVPETGGSIEPGYELGSVARITHGCEVYVRGAESGDDVERFRSAYALGDRLLACIRAAAPGRITFGKYEDSSPTDVDAYGAELVMSFSYARDVWHDATRMALPAATADEVDPVPAIPPGEPAEVGTVGVTVTPSFVEEES